MEVELVDGRTRDLDAVERALVREVGLHRSRWPSKLARALGDTAPDPDDAPSRVRVGKRTSAGVVVLAYLDEQVADLLARDAEVRRDAPDAVHKMRVATRRLRSALKTYGPLFDDVHVESTRAELKWLGERLGRPRDAEVQRDGLLDLLAQQPRAHVFGPVRRRITSEMKSRHDAAHRDLVVALDGARYERLLGRLDRLVRTPGLGDRADRTAREEMRALTATAVKRFDRTARRAATVSSPDELDVALHEVRKAAKRARYAAEAATPVGGTGAARIAKAMEDVQEVLGEHQDTVTTRALLRELALVADAASESSFTYGVLHGAEHERGRLARARYGGVLRAARKGKVRAWLN